MNLNGSLNGKPIPMALLHKCALCDKQMFGGMTYAVHLIEMHQIEQDKANDIVDAEYEKLFESFKEEP